MNYQDSNNHFRIKTDFRVKPEHWIAGKEKIKPSYFDELDFSIEQKNKLIQRYSDLKNRIEKDITIGSVSGTPITKEYLLDTIDLFFNKKVKPEKESLNQYIERYITEITNGKRLHNHRGTNEPERYKDGTIKNYEGFRNIWNNFQGEKKLDFQDINDSVYKSFIQYCFHLESKRGSADPGLATNTIGRHIKNLKTILKSARLEKLHTNTEYETFPVPKEDVFNIYLTEGEQELLYNLKLDIRDEQIRDLFLIGCFSLQRFSDYSRICPEMIQTTPEGGKNIELIQVKTKTRVIIPIRPTMDILLKKYNYQVPKIPQQEVNDIMKVIGELAGINNPIQIEKNNAGLRKSITLPKSQLIKTHTARRSGCTNLYKDDIPTLDIMEISGHKTERDFLKYICVSPEETADRLSKNPNFNKPSW